jgi:plasmid stabilization system protein ParE
MRVLLTKTALADLSAIRTYIGRENPAAASRVAIQLVAACDRLEFLPERGRPGLVPGTRELTVIWPYIIVYRVTSEAVEVLNIWHGARARRGPE